MRWFPAFLFLTGLVASLGFDEMDFEDLPDEYHWPLFPYFNISFNSASNITSNAISSFSSMQPSVMSDAPSFSDVSDLVEEALPASDVKLESTSSVSAEVADSSVPNRVSEAQHVETSQVTSEAQSSESTADSESSNPLSEFLHAFESLLASNSLLASVSEYLQAMESSTGTFVEPSETPIDSPQQSSDVFSYMSPVHQSSIHESFESSFAESSLRPAIYYPQQSSVVDLYETPVADQQSASQVYSFRYPAQQSSKHSYYFPESSETSSAQTSTLLGESPASISDGLEIYETFTSDEEEAISHITDSSVFSSVSSSSFSYASHVIDEPNQFSHDDNETYTDEESASVLITSTLDSTAYSTMHYSSAEEGVMSVDSSEVLDALVWNPQVVSSAKPTSSYFPMLHFPLGMLNFKSSSQASDPPASTVEKVSKPSTSAFSATLFEAVECEYNCDAYATQASSTTVAQSSEYYPDQPTEICHEESCFEPIQSLEYFSSKVQDVSFVSQSPAFVNSLAAGAIESHADTVSSAVETTTTSLVVAEESSSLEPAFHSQLALQFLSSILAGHFSWPSAASESVIPSENSVVAQETNHPSSSVITSSELQSSTNTDAALAPSRDESSLGYYEYPLSSTTKLDSFPSEVTSSVDNSQAAPSDVSPVEEIDNNFYFTQAANSINKPAAVASSSKLSVEAHSSVSYIHQAVQSSQPAAQQLSIAADHTHESYASRIMTVSRAGSNQHQPSVSSPPPSPSATSGDRDTSPVRGVITVVHSIFEPTNVPGVPITASGATSRATPSSFIAILVVLIYVL
ncbi:hypothetical protein Cantr_08582 [Candida viswanathii]|uniref:Uncharacterized protein n=1 Tax=Candida viswanathii TaxID=5486 RepID=A0A367Y613_9ASCO|nr:hypothetical protein Cantr_08582 [Candida viswanathii]